jgi:hypothetical protein
MKRERIYVAGPYTSRKHDEHSSCVVETQWNVNKAMEIGNELLRKGHFIYVPHYTHYLHIARNGNLPISAWYGLDNTFIECWATALFYIAPSPGADAELALAKKLGRRIFLKLEDVPNLWEVPAT